VTAIDKSKRLPIGDILFWMTLIAASVTPIVRDLIAARGFVLPDGTMVGRDFLNAWAGGQLVVDGLPRVPEGKAYELWAFRAGTPRPAGVFHVDHAGHAAVSVAAAGGAVDGFAISVEPVGGVPAPTGPIVLASAR